MDANVPAPEPTDRAALRRNRSIALVIFAAFVLPIMVAYWFAVVRPAAAPQHRLNHGTLLVPPIEVAATPALAPLATLALPVSDWAIIYYGPGACGDDCAKQVATLADIRQVIGNVGPRVHVVAVTDNATVTPARATLIGDATARAALAAAVGARLGQSTDSAVVFLDWRGFVMMSFALTDSPADIKADLKRLLTASATH